VRGLCYVMFYFLSIWKMNLLTKWYTGLTHGVHLSDDLYDLRYEGGKRQMGFKHYSGHTHESVRLSSDCPAANYLLAEILL